MSDKIKVVRFKDIHNWSADKSGYKKIGNKLLDLIKGQHFLDILGKYDIGICSINSGSKSNYLEQQGILLKGEKDFIEHRIKLGKKMELDYFLDNEGIEDFDSLDDEEKESIMELYEVKGYDEDSDIEYSCFLPKINNINNVHVGAESFNYFKFLVDSGSYKDIFGGYYEELIGFENIKELTNLVKQIGIKQINVDDLEIIVSYNKRFYKDSKFFALLSKSVPNYNSMISELIALAKG